MPTVSVRLSKEEKQRLLQHGSLSHTIRAGIRLYLDAAKAQSLVRRLEKLQRRNPVRTTTLEEVKLLREDRRR